MAALWLSSVGRPKPAFRTAGFDTILHRRRHCPHDLESWKSGSYSVAIEKGLNYFGAQGIWDLDDKERPTAILFYPTDDMGNTTDTLSYALGRVVRPHDLNLDVELTRNCDGTDIVTYTFRFDRIQ